MALKEHLTTKIGLYGIIIKEKKLLLLTPVKGRFLMFAGGRLDFDEEDCISALKREIAEETGLELLNAEPFDVKMWS